MTLEINALRTAISGMQKQEVKVAKAAADINNAFTAAQNAAAADSVSVSDRAAVVPAVEDAVRGAVLPAEGDVSTAIVDLLQAATAYKANAATVRVTADVEKDVMDIIGKRGS
jgi:flagellar hook protein FlgE